MNITEIQSLLDSGVYIKGKCNTPERSSLVEEAISILQGSDKFCETQYMGIKNYASFGDQRSDHDYNRVPTHGSIVFKIGKEPATPVIDKNKSVDLLLYVAENPDIDIMTELRLYLELDIKFKAQKTLIENLTKAVV